MNIYDLLPLIHSFGSIYTGIFLCLLIGFVTGIVSSVFGVGGGFIITPFFHSFLNVTGTLAVASSVGQIPLVSLSGIFKYAKSNKIKFKPLIFLLLGAIPSSQLLASYLGNIKNTVWGKTNIYGNLTAADLVIMGTFVFIIGGLGLYNIKKSKENIAQGEYVAVKQLSKPNLTTFILGLAFGFFSVLLGIGGGFFCVPYFVYYCGLTSVEAVATTLVALFITSTFTTIHYIYIQEIYFSISLIIAIGGIIGAQVGAHYALKSKSGKILLYLGYVQIFAAFFYIFTKFVL
jgi:uncharacterized membrane protein YfcA